MNKSILKEKPRFNYSSYSWEGKLYDDNLSINNIIREMACQGGIASVKKRFQGKSKKEISEIMKNVRKGVNKDV
jgi:hypothetical protein